MDLGISGRVALVLGGSRGIGRGIAAALAREGARVAIASRSREHLDQAVAELDGELTPFVADTGELERIGELPGAVEAALGPVEILVTNTGGPPPGLFEDLTEDAWRAGIDGALMNVVRMSRLVLPAMRAAKYGRIVHLTSFVAKQPMALLTISSTLRAGLSALTKTMGSQVAADGITVNAVLPGHFATDRQIELNELKARQHGITRAAWEDRVRAEIPARRFGRPEEFGDLVAFLLSERAGYINGTSLQIDGGLTAGTF